MIQNIMFGVSKEHFVDRIPRVLQKSDVKGTIPTDMETKLNTR